MPDCKQRVVEQYAKAAAVFVEPKKQLGQRAPRDVGGWKIHHAPGPGGIVLGEGNSEDAAWQDAWNKIDASMDCDPTAVDE